MLPLQCRECGISVQEKTERCPGCGCQTPFACSACGKGLSHFTLGVRRSSRHPHGSFSPAGVPLCHEHRLTRCHKCAQLYPMVEMRERVIGKREDTNLRQGMKPRVENAMAMFCTTCNPSGSAAAKRQVPPTRRSSMALVALIVLLLACACVPVVFLILNHRI